MTTRVINTLGSMFHRKAKPMSDDQIELPLDPSDVSPTVNTILGVRLAGEGSSTPEIHIVYLPVGSTVSQIQVAQLTNPVTSAQIAGIFSALN